MSHQKSNWRKLGAKSGTKSFLSKEDDKFNPKKNSKIVEKDREVFAVGNIKASQSQNFQPDLLSVK